MVALVIPLLLAGAFEVERVLAMVNGVPVLASDADLAEAGALIPRQQGESDDAYRYAVVEALIDLELRWQDLEAVAITQRVPVDLDAAWRKVVQRVGGEGELHLRLQRIGLPEAALRELIRRAAVVEAYVASRFGPLARPTPQEVQKAWEEELVPKLKAAGQPVPDLAQVRANVEALLRERKLAAEVERWTSDVAKRAEIIRYLSVEGGSASAPPPTPTLSTPRAPRLIPPEAGLALPHAGGPASAPPPSPTAIVP
ncbi:MAG TPA: hypothetical protein VMT45_01180 [Thermoanaerobaculaceae bacterium]|nr:hypothetical protein [Thermoanaerobaculaceae bacterium]